MDDQVLDVLARYFRALAEPLRLKILDSLREEAMNVGQLTQRLGCSQANVSKHLSVLMEAGLVEREARGTTAWYRFADPEVYELCDLVCGQVGRRLAGGDQLRGLLAAMARRHRGEDAAAGVAAASSVPARASAPAAAAPAAAAAARRRTRA